MPRVIDNLKEKLVEETRRQVMEQGYENVNIRSIAAGCGVGVGTVYNYYPSKDALIATFMAQDWVDCLGKIQAKADEGAGAEDILKGFYVELKEFRGRYQNIFQSASASLAAPPRQYHNLLRGQLAKLIRPFCRGDFDSEFVAESMLAWTSEGKSFEEIYDVVRRLLA